jgi:hypothetical protein
MANSSAGRESMQRRRPAGSKELKMEKGDEMTEG